MTMYGITTLVISAWSVRFRISLRYVARPLHPYAPVPSEFIVGAHVHGRGLTRARLLVTRNRIAECTLWLSWHILQRWEVASDVKCVFLGGRGDQSFTVGRDLIRTAGAL
jgi:hypothetical protein